jgi:hypothetical protein
MKTGAAILVLLCGYPLVSEGRAGVARSTRSPIVSQTRLVPNPAGADELTDGSNRLIWVGGSGVVVYNLRTKQQTVVVGPQSHPGPASLNGKWVVYLAANQQVFTGTKWSIMALNLRTRRTTTVAAVDPKIPALIDHHIAPTFAVSQGKVLWNSWRRIGGKIVSIIGVTDLSTGRSRIVRSMRASVQSGEFLDRSYASVSIYGQQIAWCRWGAQDGSSSPTLWTENLSHGGLARIATQVNDGHLQASGGLATIDIWGTRLVYARAANGDRNVYMYRTDSRKSTRITKVPGGKSAGWWAADPSVGSSVVAWLQTVPGEKSDMGPPIGAYDLAHGHLMSLTPSDGGRIFTAGKIMLYVASTRPKHPEGAAYALVIDRLR